MIDVVALLGGMVLLYFGAEWLVAGSARLAASFGVRPLVVGLTVVAYGTSAPELVVGIGASLTGQGAIALGNVIGSNIANLGLILGIAALIKPPGIDASLAGRETAVLVIATALVPLSLLDGEVVAWEGVALLGMAAGYTVWMVRTSRVAPARTAIDLGAVADAAADAALVPRAQSRRRLIGLALIGLALLVIGGHFLVEGAVGLARQLGMSERLIGLTIVAVGTSLPELATSIVAALRGHSDLAVGNVIGSNIFNVLLILGASGVAGRIEADLATIALDLVVLGAITAITALMFRFRDRVSRAEGLMLLVGYAGFLTALVLTAE